MIPQRTPLFQAPGAASDKIQSPDERLPVNPAADLTANIMRGVNTGQELRDPPNPSAQPDPTDHVDVELSDIPFTKKELASGVSKDTIVKGKYQFAAFKIPEKVEQLNDFMKTASCEYSCGAVDLVTAPQVMDTQTGVFVLVWYRTCKYPRRKKSS